MRHTPRRSLAALVLTFLAAFFVVVAPTSYAAGPPPSRSTLGLTPLPTSPDGDPPGANDWSCRPSAAHPTPVILVHGTVGDRKHLLERLSGSIKRAGFCVYSLDYGNRGLDDIVESAHELKRYTLRVLRSTGAEKVSMVGHSQGGMMPRYLIKFLHGRSLVDDLVGIAPSNHGTALTAGGNPISDLVNELLGVACRACVQQGAGSPFLTRLNEGDETPGPVSYTQITTRYDEIVVPHTSGYLAAGPRTTNLTLQDLCPFAIPEHLTIPFATPTIDIVLDALTRSGPADPEVAPRCL